MYKGAKYIGGDPVKIGGTNRVLRNGDIYDNMSEAEAKGRRDFEPVYETVRKAEVKEEKKYTSEDDK